MFTCTNYSVFCQKDKKLHSNEAVYMANKHEYSTNIPVYMQPRILRPFCFFASKYDFPKAFPPWWNYLTVCTPPPSFIPSATFAKRSALRYSRISKNLQISKCLVMFTSRCVSPSDQKGVGLHTRHRTDRKQSVRICSKIRVQKMLLKPE